MNEVYNLERQTALENRIDPTGRKWDIKGERGSSLVHARPNPDRSDAQIPKEFKGRWTSPSTLREKIDVWLNKQWDASELQTLKLDRKNQAAKEVARQTPEESLAELPDEIKQELGDVIAVEEPDGTQTTEASEGQAQAQADNDQECTGGSAHTGSQEEKKEEIPLESRPWHELQKIAKDLGVKPSKKAELIAGIRQAEE